MRSCGEDQSPKTHRKGSSGCTRVGMETCLVRLSHDYTPTWGSRRVRANHMRHDPGRSVPHARATLVCSARRPRWLQSLSRFSVPRKDTRKQQLTPTDHCFLKVASSSSSRRYIRWFAAIARHPSPLPSALVFVPTPPRVDLGSINCRATISVAALPSHGCQPPLSYEHNPFVRRSFILRYVINSNTWLPQSCEPCSRERRQCGVA
jgi:hypothetical protein